MTFKIEIEDLEESEAQHIKDYLVESVEEDDLPSIQDCITVLKQDEDNPNHWTEVN